MSKENKLDFEINLLPVISMLAVCISFLLLTTVWIQIGSLDVTQAYGTESSAADKSDKKTLYLTFDDSGRLQLEVKSASGKTFSRISNIQTSQIEAQIRHNKDKFPDLSAAILKPHAMTSYENVILVMDMTRKNSVREIGVAPL